MAVEERSETLSLLTLPTDVRTILYDTFFLHGYTIWISFEGLTSIGGFVNLLRVCRQLHAELTTYLASKPLVLVCTRWHRPSGVQGIPWRILHQVEVIVVEDDLEREISLKAFPKVKTICLLQVSQSSWVLKNRTMEQVSGLNAPLTRDGILRLLSNNEALSRAHAFWKEARLQYEWIYLTWKERPEIRFILRRIEEVFVDDLDKDQPTVASVRRYHSVVDVPSRSVITKSFLPAHRDERAGTDHVFDYGAQNWWRRERELKQAEKADAV